ncbi:hypothetical protein PRIPAC_81197, partial [Pristionchus pacificus]|uniref:Uncharacterized protein n=1 Tax=Pristionchus pacificus TaxID=54126 RepID=A0A2A6CMK7_PRIPA
MSNRDCAHLGADSLCASIDALSGYSAHPDKYGNVYCIITLSLLTAHFFGVSVDVIDRCGPGNTTTTRVTFEILSAVDGTTIAKFTLDITHNSTFVGQVISSQGVILDNGRPGGSDNVSCPDGLACRSNFLFFK